MESTPPHYTTKPKLLNNAQVKKYLLEVAGQKRHQKFTRVSSDTLFVLEAQLKAAIHNHIATIPSKGKTL